MAKSDASRAKTAGKTRGARTSPPSSTPNEREQASAKGEGRRRASVNPKVGKQQTGTGRKGGGLH